MGVVGDSVMMQGLISAFTLHIYSEIKPTKFSRIYFWVSVYKYAAMLRELF